MTNMPPTTTENLGSTAAGDSHRHALATPTDPNKSFRVALVGRDSIARSDQLDEQLRKRLRFIAAVAALGVSSSLMIRIILLGRELLLTLETLTPQHFDVLDYFALAAAEWFAVAQLSRQRRSTHRRLRWLEALVFIPVVHFFILDAIGVLARGTDEFANHWPSYANALSVPFVLLIVSYGVLIPNTGRRCVLAVALIAASGFIGPAVGFTLVPHSMNAAVPFLVQVTVWLGMASAVVVYGAYRIEVLRDQAERYRELGQYRLTRVLGSGGMGEVYLAEHRFLRRPCAIKLIRPERAGSAENLARFEREVQATATLTHPNTVQVFDYGQAEDGTFFYAMEYLPGMTLEQIVTVHGPLPPARAVHLLRQICGALREAHSIGLIHRDIKPGNVMVCDRGGIADVAKLLDFGLVMPRRDALLSERLTQEGNIAGTPAYMSPEQADGQGDLDARSDIYSLGALTYFALTGQAPFAGRSTVKILAAHLYEIPDPPTKLRPDVPADLEAITLRCLAKNAAERYASAAELEAALTACETAGQWSATEAAAWWRAQAGSAGSSGEPRPTDGQGLTTC